MSQKTPDLQAAYSLQTPEDSRKLYADWADSYDSDFINRNDYQLHRYTAQVYANRGGTGPALDVGAGTGACGSILRDLGVEPLDAMDISAEMLTQAMAKDIYRTSIVADLTLGPPASKDSYAGIVSSGTFTTGHVGPDGIDHLMQCARPGALFAISINCQHYENAGFARKFDSLSDQIRNLNLFETKIYGEAATGANKDDKAFIALFHKL